MYFTSRTFQTFLHWPPPLQCCCTSVGALRCTDGCVVLLQFSLVESFPALFSNARQGPGKGQEDQRVDLDQQSAFTRAVWHWHYILGGRKLHSSFTSKTKNQVPKNNQSVPRSTKKYQKALGHRVHSGKRKLHIIRGLHCCKVSNATSLSAALCTVELFSTLC